MGTMPRAAAPIAVSVLSCFPCGAQEPAAAERPLRAAGLRVAAWLERHAQETADGVVWPVQPKEPDKVETNLYSGSAGVVLFFLRAHRSTGQERFLTLARRGADALVARLPAGEERVAVGLYTGVAGVGFVLAEVHVATQDAKYRQAARRCVGILKDAAQEVGDGVEWSKVNDIIGGTAGVGMFLLYASRRLGDERALPLAEAAGRRLLAVARKTEHGLAWDMSPGYARYMPNFSHGTAGVAAFLLDLAGATGKGAFADAGRKGAMEVAARADAKTELVPHHLPGGEALYYLGWCHGPAGTAGLYRRMSMRDEDPVWRQRLRTAADAVIATGCPQERTPGFWNNESVCCGTAGIAQFYLDLFRLTGVPADRDHARACAQVLLARAEREGGGMSWRQAEHRVRPDGVATQTGYMQGAAGIGCVLFDLDDGLRGVDRSIRLPDAGL